MMFMMKEYDKVDDLIEKDNNGVFTVPIMKTTREVLIMRTLVHGTL